MKLGDVINQVLHEIECKFNGVEPTIVPIPTTYRGVEMRSRLEARWAYFFDLAKLEWQYEPQCFSLHIGAYLPDFFLPQADVYAEIKPTNPTVIESAKCQQLAKLTSKTVLCFCGQPTHNKVWIFSPKGSATCQRLQFTDSLLRAAEKAMQHTFY